MARAVELVGRLQRCGVVEELEGLPLELFLALLHRLTRAIGACWLRHAGVLQRLPVTRVDPDTGQFTIRRNGRTWRSLPRGTPLNRPPPPPDEPNQHHD